MFRIHERKHPVSRIFGKTILLHDNDFVNTVSQEISNDKSQQQPHYHQQQQNENIQKQEFRTNYKLYNQQ